MATAENPVSTREAAIQLGLPGKPWGKTRMSSLKRAMNISGTRFVFVSAIRKYVKDHPEFRERQIYSRSK